MKPLSRTELSKLLMRARIKSRLVRDLRYIPEAIHDWSDYDFLVVTTKSGNEGVMILPDNTVKHFELHKRVAASGRVSPIICDFCATWQRGSNSATISFIKQQSSVSYLVCGDLRCSLHVRDKTEESRLSRSQLRENISVDQRIRRLQQRLSAIFAATT